jgi:hypothetical protein
MTEQAATTEHILLQITQHMNIFCSKTQNTEHILFQTEHILLQITTLQLNMRGHNEGGGGGGGGGEGGGGGGGEGGEGGGGEGFGEHTSLPVATGNKATAVEEGEHRGEQGGDVTVEGGVTRRSQKEFDDLEMTIQALLTCLRLATHQRHISNTLATHYLSLMTWK